MISHVTRDDDRYEAARSSLLWNKRVPDRYPDVIFTPGTRDEVALAVRQAIADGHRVAIKSGGHSWIGSPLREGGALIDLSALTAVEVDTGGSLAFVEPAATHRLLALAIESVGFAFPTGHCPSVGLGGYLLAGGVGWNPRTWGPACMSVRAVEAVTAAGEQILASEYSHPDLYWAARGAGPGFPAVVTRFHLELQPLPRILARRMPFQLHALPELARWTAQATQELPPGIEISLIARRPPESNEPRVTIAATSFAKTVEEARELLRPLGTAPCSELSLGESPIEEVRMTDLEGEGGWSEGLRYAVDSCDYRRESVPEVGAVVEDSLRQAPSNLTRIVMTFASFPAGVADVAMQPRTGTGVSVYSTWEHPADDGSNVAWVRDVMRQLTPSITGHYVGETDLEADANRAAACFPPHTWERLQRIRSSYDPEQRFYGYLAPA